MIALSHSEAVLFRVLTSFFGSEHVIPNMSVMAVCGGKLPDRISGVACTNGYCKALGSIDLVSWAKNNKCLFTIVDRSDEPCMVIEFFSSYARTIEVVEVEHQRYLKPILDAVGINYVTMTSDEFSDIVNPSSTLDFFSFLKAKVEPSKLAPSPHKRSVQ